MKIRGRRYSPLLLLLLPSVTAAIASAADSTAPQSRLAARDTSAEAAVGAAAASSSKKGTKDAPVDGKDGKPHAGPWVDTPTGRKKGETSRNDPDDDDNLPVLEHRPADPTIIDGKKIPDTNDGVMDDPNRTRAKEGTTGTQGGVSEKDKARKAQEDISGEKVEKKPEAPKEAPPLPHSESEKILDKEGKKAKEKGDPTADDSFGLEVSGFLSVAPGLAWARQSC